MGSFEKAPSVVAQLVRELSTELFKTNTKLSDMEEKRDALETRLRLAVTECRNAGIELGEEFEHIKELL